jgi:hypothetical protein
MTLALVPAVCPSLVAYNFNSSVVTSSDAEALL